MACCQLLRQVQYAEEAGTTTGVFELARQIGRLPPGTAPLDVFDIFDVCRAAGWIMGSVIGVCLTAEGRQKIAVC